MTEAHEGMGEQAPNNEQKREQTGKEERQGRRRQDHARTARREHNERVIENIRGRLHQQKTTIREVTHFPTDPEALAQHNAWLDSLSPGELRAHTEQIHSDWDKQFIRGGLSLPEYLARHPEVDPDLFTPDGRYLPGMRFGWERYELKKLGKFILRVLEHFVTPADKK